MTLGKHNSSFESLKNYIGYFNNLGVSVLRFNSFTDHGKNHPDLPLNDLETRELYKNLSWIHNNLDLRFQLGISEDIGTEGIGELNLPSHVGWCRAGRQLFAITPTPYEEKEVITSDGLKKLVGILVGCVNIFDPVLGKLYRIKDHSAGSISYKLEFDEGEIEKFNQDRMNGNYKNGCFAKELLAKNPPKLVRK